MGLPAVHQLGPTCRCATCEAHRALSALSARVAELESTLDDLYTDAHEAMEVNDYWGSSDALLRAGTVLAKGRH
jgi:hypothetical protein